MLDVRPHRRAALAVGRVDRVFGLTVPTGTLAVADEFVFQVEVSYDVGQATVRVEGRCIGGDIRTGDKFTEVVLGPEAPAGAVDEVGPRVVDAWVDSLVSVRPGLLGICESGTLLLRLHPMVSLNRGALLRGYR